MNNILFLSCNAVQHQAAGNTKGYRGAAHITITADCSISAKGLAVDGKEVVLCSIGGRTCDDDVIRGESFKQPANKTLGDVSRSGIGQLATVSNGSPYAA